VGRTPLEPVLTHSGGLPRKASVNVGRVARSVGTRSAYSGGQTWR